MHLELVRVKDTLGGEVPFLLDSFDQLPDVGRLRAQAPKIDALRVVCGEPGLPRDWHTMTRLCAEAALPLAFDSDPLQHHQVWLFVSHASWLPDDRVRRHKKLWGNLSEEHLLDSLRCSPEVAFRSELGIRYAAVCRLTPGSFAEGARVLRGLRSSAMLLTERAAGGTEEYVRSLFGAAFPIRKGVPDNRVDWIGLAARFCPLGDVLVRAGGSFDERECSLDFVGEAALIDRLTHASLMRRPG